MLKVISLFGGLSADNEALNNIGINHNVVDYVEIDKFAVKSFNAMNGTDFETQDVCEWNKDVKADLIFHGSPCTDYSVAGKQEGGDEGSETRSSLMWETVRIIEKVTPKYVIWENVKNVLSKKHKHNFDKYVERLDELGYNSYYKVLNTKDYGLPQNRERVFCISIKKELDVGFEFPEKQELKLRLKDILEDEVDEKYYLKEEQYKNFLHNLPKLNTHPGGKGINGNVNIKDIANTILDDRGQKILEPKIIKVGKINSSQDGVVHSTNGISQCLSAGHGNSPKIIKLANESGNHYGGGLYDKKGISPTLTSSSGGGGTNNIPKIIIDDTQGFEKEPRVYEDCSPTLRTSRSGYNEYRIRRLTPNSELYNLLLLITMVSDIIINEVIDNGKKTRSRKILQILWKEISEKTIQWSSTEQSTFQQADILRQGMYEKGLYKERCDRSKFFNCTRECKTLSRFDIKERKMRELWEDWKIRFTPQRFELEEQRYRELDLFMQKLPYANTCYKEQMYCLWRTSERSRILQQALFEVQEIWGSFNDKEKESLQEMWRTSECKRIMCQTLSRVETEQIRIRKLLPIEVWRLQGFSDEQFAKAELVNSKTQLYKQAGNSITITVLEAIFKQMIKFGYINNN